jgi:membrane protein YqaA with SNARE-associated domain
MRILKFILYFVALATVGSYIDYRIGYWLERRRCVKQLNEAIRGWRRP